ncbi:MAG: hypothetical protein AABW91_03125 [Nanoarchaeota archaeon]
MKNIKAVFLFVLLLTCFILLISSVFAQGYYGGYGGGNGFFGNFYFPTPDSFLNNEWVIFVSLFLVFFCFIYLSLQGIFKRGGDKLSDERRGPVVAIALVIAFIAAAYFTYPFYNFLHGYSYSWSYFFYDWYYRYGDLYYNNPGIYYAIPIIISAVFVLVLWLIFRKK